MVVVELVVGKLQEEVVVVVEEDLVVLALVEVVELDVKVELMSFFKIMDVILRIKKFIKDSFLILWKTVLKSNLKYVFRSYCQNATTFKIIEIFIFTKHIKMPNFKENQIFGQKKQSQWSLNPMSSFLIFSIYQNNIHFGKKSTSL